MIVDVLLALSLTIRPPAAPDIPMPLLVQADRVPRAERVTIYGPKGELRTTSRVPLSPAAQADFDAEFATASYFGAFAVSKDGGWGYSVGNNGLAAAREIALQECLAVNPSCLVHTELVPQGYADPGPGEVTLSPEVADQYRDAASNTRFAAMAVSADGAYSKVWGHASPREAESTALAECERNRIADLPLSDMPCVLLPRPGKVWPPAPRP
jgi:hypothetical protein